MDSTSSVYTYKLVIHSSHLLGDSFLSQNTAHVNILGPNSIPHFYLCSESLALFNPALCIFLHVNTF